MTVFKATQPVTLTAGNVASLFGFLSHKPAFEIVNGNEFKVEDHAHSIEVDFRSVPGHPFTYSLHGPTGGLLASLQLNQPAGAVHIAFKFSGMAVPMATLVSDVQHGHWGAVLNLFLGGNDVVTGSTGPDYLAGFGGNDRITGGPGHDILRGGAGNDTFVFRAGFGMDVIKDFVPGEGPTHDVIEMHSFPGIHTLAQVKAHSTFDASHHLVINVDASDTITLSTVTSTAQLTLHDFHFLA